MDESLQERLRRLGVQKGTRHLRIPPVLPVTPPAPTPQASGITFRPAQGLDGEDVLPLTQLLPGSQVVETAVGSCLVVDRVYPPGYQHGANRLAEALALPLATAVPFVADPRLAECQMRHLLFLDTETTGLAGAGTVAFLIGVAFFSDEALVVRQYFLRDYDDEAAALTLLRELAAQKQGLISFNGRSFDLPLLDGRYLLNRLQNPLADLPHLDLLQPARRLWRMRLGSCALGALEQTLLGARRTQEDVPGWLIPGLYQQYLRSGDARELLRVFYHNQIDVLSMVTLAARILQLLRADPTPHPLDQLSLAKWQAELGLWQAAEHNLRAAIAADLPLEAYHDALQTLALLLKRQERRAEALPFWQQLAATSFDDVTAHVELAKYYEWHVADLPAAMRWAEQGLKLAQSWGGARAALAQEELARRLARLRQKQQATEG